MIHQPSGYAPCACRDCFEITLCPGTMCHACDDAGCDPRRECQAAGAYGGEPEECEDNDCAGCAWCDALPEHAPAPADPERDLGALMAELDGLAPAARVACEGIVAAMPAAARADGHHPFWSSAEAADLLLALVMTLNTAERA